MAEDPKQKQLERLWDSAISDFPGQAYRMSGQEKMKEVGSTAEMLGKDTLLGGILDFLGRGEYASANLAKSYKETGDVNLKMAWRGFTGKDKTTYTSLIDSSYPEWPKWKRMAVGFTLSMVADPTTYIPQRAIQKGVSTVGRAARKVPGAETAIKAADESFVSKAFRPQAGLPKDYYETKYYAQKGFEAERHRIFEDLEEIRGGLSKDEMEQLSFYREHPQMVDGMNDKLKSKLEIIGQRFDTQIDKAEQAGIIPPEVANKWRKRDIPYLPHYYPGQKGGIGIAKGEIPPTLFEKMKKPSFTKKRKIDTLEDAKSVSQQFDDIASSGNMVELKNKVKSYGLDSEFDRLGALEFKDLKAYAKAQSKYYKPEENIIKALGFRELEQAGFTARTQFVDDVMMNFGHRVQPGTKIPPEGYGLYFPKGSLRFFPKDTVDPKHLEKLAERYEGVVPFDEIEGLVQQFPSITKRVPVYMLPESIASDMNRMNKFFFGDPSTGKLAQLFDKPQGIWKGMATAMRMPFHVRNMYSNWFQAYLSGVNPAKLPQRLSQAAQFQAGKLKQITLGNKTYKADEFTRLVEDLGIRGRGWIGSDVQRSFAMELDSMIRWGKLRKATPMQVGKKIGTTVEDNSRLAVFMDRLAKGQTPKEASQAVRKYMFDYQELTPFEKNVMRRVFPFYTWTRKNAPLQIQNLITKPRKYQVYAKGQRALSEPETKQERVLKPEYFNEMLYMKSPFSTPQGKTLYMSIDLPPQEFNRVSSVRHWVSSLTPWKLAAELHFNKKTFPELSDIERFAGDKTQAPFWVAWLPNQVKQGMKDHGLIDTIQIKGRRVLGMDKKWVHGLHSAFPFLNELNRIYAQPILMTDETPSVKWKSYVSGISLAPLDKQKQRTRKYYDTLKGVKNIEDFAKQHMRPPSKREMEELRMTR